MCRFRRVETFVDVLGTVVYLLLALRVHGIGTKTPFEVCSYVLPVVFAPGVCCPRVSFKMSWWRSHEGVFLN